MAQAQAPEPLKYFIAILYRTSDALELGKRALSEEWGKIDFEGKDHLFDMTEYYKPEMGAPLFRRLVTFENLLLPTELVGMKLGCNQIEDRLAVSGHRIVNLDAGYLDHNKVVLASVKNFGHKIYLDRGIYADCVGLYKQGRYQPFDWTFPDFKDGRYDEELLTIRQRYLQQMRQWRKRHDTPEK
ncbi:GTP-binding protein [candidate division KSB3 bacterium]|uniref:GTP-binding protein n=1 Tax=candidate division KSB3 bacterium TaxID=2044937 RepID=A0A2G6K8S4_9BACT|nr:MAG: GTP-binding protein [candidate division KSB3 bacterium]